MEENSEKPNWLKKAKNKFSNIPPNILSLPYTLKETLNWLLKHINIYIGWTLSATIVLIIISIFNFLAPFWYLTFLIIIIILMFWGVNYLSRVVYKKLYTTKIFGEMDKKIGWFKGVLNKKIQEPKFWIGFVGDIMKMNKYNLTFDNGLREFFKYTKLIVGNLEGIITKKKSGWASQNHREELFKNLKELTENENIDWLICMSNNHSGDFGYNEFKHTWDLALKEEIEIFGPRERPCFPDEAYLNQKNDNFSETSWSSKSLFHLALAMYSFDFCESISPYFLFFFTRIKFFILSKKELILDWIRSESRVIIKADLFVCPLL